MSITATELKNNLGKYLLLSATEDVFITNLNFPYPKWGSHLENSIFQLTKQRFMPLLAPDGARFEDIRAILIQNLL